METKLERCSMKEAGIAAAGINQFLKEINEEGYHMHSMMITRHGKVAMECSWFPYRLEDRHLMHSFTKGLVASAIGILEGEKRIHLDDTVLSYFPEYQIEDPTGRAARMTLRHLLTMTDGHDGMQGRHGCDDEVRAFFEAPYPYEPGTTFAYSSNATNMLASIVRKVSGFSLFHFLQVRLFDAMGIQGVYCDTCISGMDQGGGGSHLKPEDMAKLTVLYLNRGSWNGQQLIPADWIDRMTSVQFADCKDAGNPDWEDWKCGYGFQVWMCTPPHSFRFDGMFGQLGVVLKDYDASVVMTCGEHVTEDILRKLWKYVIPALENGDSCDPQEQAREEALLEETIKNQRVCWSMEHEVPEEEREVLWKKLLGRKILFPENRDSVLSDGRVANSYTSTWAEQRRSGIQSLSLKYEEGSQRDAAGQKTAETAEPAYGRILLEYEDNGNTGILPVGIHGVPEEGLLRSLWGDYRMWSLARWNADGKLELQIRMVEGEYYHVFTFDPQGDTVAVHVYGGPWDRRIGRPEGRNYVCRLK